MRDILIIGGGAAGMTAGLYAARAGLQTLLIESNFIGGQTSTTDLVMNYPGFPEGIGGPELMMRFEEQAQKFGLIIEYAETSKLELAGVKKRAVTSDGREWSARCVILAMGASPRKLGVPGEDQFYGRGVSYCATCDGAFYRGKHVAVVGGGDTAVEDALYLARASSVTVIHRRADFRAKGHAVAEMGKLSQVDYRMEQAVESIEQAENGLRLNIKDVTNDARSQLDVAALFVAVGTDPNTSRVRGLIDLDEQGFVRAGEDGFTSIPGVFAAGDVRTKTLRQVITAASDGANAAYQAGVYLDSIGS